MLTDDELARYHRYLVPKAAHTFLAARVMLRSVLSAYCVIKPKDWRFETNPWGKPRIANPSVPARLNFNLSHTQGCVVCLAGYGRELGVDVEDTAANRTNLLELATRFFSPTETAALSALPAELQADRFFDLWTLKESYMKARGIGISLGLSRFSFAPDSERATVRFDPGFPDDPGRWEFCLFRPDTQHVIATAVEQLPELPSAVELRNATDLMARALG